MTDLRADRTMDALFAWCREFGLVADERAERWLRAMRIDRFAVHTLPGGESEELALIAQWAAFICTVDDEFDRTVSGGRPEQVESVMGELLSVLTGGVHHSPYAAAMEDLWARTAVRMTAAGRARFLTHYQDFAESSKEEAVIRASGTPLCLPEYMKIRRRTITLLPMMDVIECTAAGSMPDSWHARPVVRTLKQALVDVIGWTNDLASAAAEVSQGQDNLITVIIRDCDCTWDDAVAWATAMIQEQSRVFEEAARRAEIRARPDELSYLRAVRLFLSAALGWLAETGRFADMPEWTTASRATGTRFGAQET